jgi:hypothetical protein
MAKQTAILGLPLQLAGYEALRRTIEKAFGIIDVQAAPPYTAAEIGKVLKVVDDGNGNPVLSWEDDLTA